MIAVMRDLTSSGGIESKIGSLPLVICVEFLKMSFLSELVAFCLLFSYVGKAFGGVPVLIWESSSVTEKEDVIPALSQLDVDEFSNHLIKKVHVHKPLIVVFLEETLSVEDFSWQDTKHRGSYPQIKNITGMSSKLEFIPSVDDPIASLKELIVSHGYYMEKFDGEKLPSKPGVILTVKMKDPLNNEDRPEMLRRHDGNIADIYSQLLAKHSRIIALYTGKQSSWVEFESNRVRREASEQVSYAFDDMMIQSSSAPVLYDGGNNITLSTQPGLTGDTRKGYKRLISTFFLPEEPKKVILRLKFPKDGGRWSLSEIEYQSDDRSLILTPSTEISATLDKSFTSGIPVVFKNDSVPGVYLKFNDIQVQAYSPLERIFSPADLSDSQKTPFFTEAIWSGLIVTFVLGLILTWGIIMLLDIRTMDRFDDPKGKTITVSATD